jgi:hypothetical protein
VAIEECVALGLDGVRGIVADSKAYCQRTLGLGLEQRGGWSPSFHVRVRCARN